MDEAVDERDALFLNEALRAYVKTFPIERYLADFLAARGLSSRMDSIKKTLDDSLGAAFCCVYDEEGGVRWSLQFEKKLFDYIRETSPWLSPLGFEVLKSYSGWISWHDGLEARRTRKKHHE